MTVGDSVVKLAVQMASTWVAMLENGSVAMLENWSVAMLAVSSAVLSAASLAEQTVVWTVARKG